MNEDIKIKASLTFKNKILLDLMESHGITNISEFARSLGLKSFGLNNLIYLRQMAQTSLKNPALKKVCEYFNVPPEVILTPELKEASNKLKNVKTSEERSINSFEFNKMIVQNEIKLLEESDPEFVYERQELRELLESVMNTLNERERDVLKLRFGLEGDPPMTLVETGKVLINHWGLDGVTPERVRQIEAKALRKLKHPARAKKLKDFINK